MNFFKTTALALTLALCFSFIDTAVAADNTEDAEFYVYDDLGIDVVSIPQGNGTVEKE